ncbi:MutH/Sau3AI family endonuclease [Halorubellus salinus]|uniref:MutH/Sau3AI family endonuclease n=1 Tax=Halorubellus salinus TaxID=755309 RepID=UPI001D0828F7|nr:MutH/Sau3AI family endonuclease [Halorubellus salinus]
MTHDPIGPAATEPQIESASKGLLGRTIGSIDDTIHGQATDDRARSKMGVANVIEKGYYGIDINNDAQADFPDAGIELKVTPLNTTGDGHLLRPKERLVLCMVDYNALAEADHWRDVPGLRKKLSAMHIVWYIHFEDTNRSEYPIIWTDIWRPTDEWDRRFQEDFEICQEKVLNGEVPSERHVDYLGTCPKHGGGYKKDNPSQSAPNSTVAKDAHPVLDHAERRGWSIALGGMLDVLMDSTGLEKATHNYCGGVDAAEFWELMQSEATGDTMSFARYKDLAGYIPADD